MPPLLNFRREHIERRTIDPLRSPEDRHGNNRQREEKGFGTPKNRGDGKRGRSDEGKAGKRKGVIEELEKERKKKEQELEGEKAQIKKVEAKLHEVKTNKEYQAILKETEAARAENDKTEEEIIVLMERTEELKKDYQSATESTEQEGKRGTGRSQGAGKRDKDGRRHRRKAQAGEGKTAGRREPGPEGAIQHPHRKKGRPRRRECQERDMSRVLHEYPAPAFYRGDEEQ